MSGKRALVNDGSGGIQELQAGDSLIDDAARRRAELEFLMQREAAGSALVKRAGERVERSSFDRGRR